MKKILTLLLITTAAGLFAQTNTWSENYTDAVAKAKKSGHYILLDFSGSDWCGWCIKLNNEVFSQPEFKAYAEKNLELVLIDKPARRQIPKETVKQNDALIQKYNVQGFPTVVILSPNEELAGYTGYQAGGAVKYVQHINDLISSFKNKKASDS